MIPCGGTSVPLQRFLCGDRALEGGEFRQRDSLFGGIVHSTPVYVGAPSARYPHDGHLEFVASNKNRAPRVYVGANDGLLHSIDAASGDELFAFSPAEVGRRLAEWASHGGHRYFVDGGLVSADVKGAFDGSRQQWRTLLVGTLGAGGRSLFALDVTDPDTTQLSDKLLWEFSATDNPNLGYTYGRAMVAKLNNGHWGVIVGNGYFNHDPDSAHPGDGRAHLLILPVVPGAFAPVDIALGDSTGNGLSTPVTIDSSGNGTADVAYAGGLDGQLWRIDLSSDDPVNWRPQLLFTSRDHNGNPQSITTAPEAVKHPRGGHMIYFATGDYFDFNQSTHNSLYALHDRADGRYPLSQARLQRVALKTLAGGEHRQAQPSAPLLPVNDGWQLDLPAGEAVLQDPEARNHRLHLVSHNLGDETHWLMQLDLGTGTGSDLTLFWDENGQPLGNHIVALRKEATLFSRAAFGHTDQRLLLYSSRWNADQTVLPTPACTKMHFERFDFAKVSSHYNVRFIAHMNDDPANDIWLKASLRDGRNSPVALTPDKGPLTGQGEGETEAGYQHWRGLDIFVDEVREDRVWMNVEYHGPYRISNFSITFDGVTLRRIHDGISTCGCTQKYRACMKGDRIDYGSSNSGVDMIGNDKGFEFNSDSPIHDGVLIGEDGVNGTTDLNAPVETQRRREMVGRIRWRELLF